MSAVRRASGCRKRGSEPVAVTTFFERKNRTKEEVDQIVCWLTGYSQVEMERQIELENNFETFFAEAPLFNPNASLIKGVVCGVRVEDAEDQ